MFKPQTFNISNALMATKIEWLQQFKDIHSVCAPNKRFHCDNYRHECHFAGPYIYIYIYIFDDDEVKRNTKNVKISGLDRDCKKTVKEIALDQDGSDPHPQQRVVNGSEEPCKDIFKIKIGVKNQNDPYNITKSDRILRRVL